MYTFPHTMVVMGTHREVGKTLVSAVLTAGLKGSYWKPIQCGVSPCTDTEWVHEMTGLPHTHFLKESYKFGEALSPITQSVGIEIEHLIPSEVVKETKHLIIEGSEGIMEPLNEKQFYVDFLKQLGAPVLLVVKNCPGAIHEALMTLEKLDEKKIPLFGIVLNGQKDPLVRRSIKEYCKPPRIFELSNIAHITENALKKAFTETFMEECA